MTQNGVTKTSKRGLVARGEILAAARELFVAKGPERTTLRDIARRLDRTTGSLYAHFPDKEAILRELVVADFLELRRAFEAAGAVADPIGRIAAIGRGYVEFAMSHPQHYRLMFMNPHDPEVESEAQARLQGDPEQDAYEFLKRTVAEGVAAGRFRAEWEDADLLAQVLWSGVHGVVALELTHCKDAWVDWRPIGRRCEVMVEGLLRGLLASRGGRSAVGDQRSAVSQIGAEAESDGLSAES